MSQRNLAVLGIAVWLLIGTPAQAQDQPRGTKLTGADLTQLVAPAVLLEGRSWQYGVWYSTALLRGGTIFRHTIDGGGSGNQDKGKWRIAGDTLCITFPTAMDSAEACRNVYKLEDGSYESWSIPDNKRVATYRARRPE